MSTLTLGTITEEKPSAPSGTERVAAKAAPADRAAREKLAESIGKTLKTVDAELATKAWLFHDPERRKALSRMRDFLQRILESLVESGDGAPYGATIELVDRASRESSRYGRENAWDFAEELRVAWYAFASPEALFSLLAKESADKTSISYETVFGEPVPKRLLERSLAQRAEVLELLRRLHHERVDRVRHDRARDKLWQHFVWKLIPVVFVLLSGCLYLQLTERGTTLLPVFAGALGSMLSAVLKLRDGEQRIRHLRRSASFLLLQPMIGGTTALVMMWIGVDNVINTSLPKLMANALVGFLAGFSEPFFLGTIGRLTEIGASNGKSSPENREAANRRKANS